MEIVDALIVVAVSFIAGTIYGEFRQNMRFIKNISEDPQNMINLITKLKDELERVKAAEAVGAPENGIELEVEQVNGIYYCYRKDTNQFMGQDTNLERLVESIHKSTGLTVWARKPEQSNQTAC